MTTTPNGQNPLLQGFSKLDRKERYQRLQQLGILSTEEIDFLQHHLPALDLAEHFIENAIGYFHLPLGLALNFVIDEKARVIPMAVEETSIIAAASKTARWIEACGHITTETIGALSIGQIQIAKVKDFAHLAAIVKKFEKQWVAEVNQQVAAKMAARGGGVKGVQLRKIARGDGETMAVIHLQVDTCDAMGANIINQACEYLKTPIETHTGEQVTMCILSNLNDSKLCCAQVVIQNIDPILGEKIAEASLFAELDPYRAATHNKGILNGMDAVLIATGNDWRAVEAGVHAYACQDGQYRAISRWRLQGQDLVGTLKAPLMTGIVGGVTALHPTAALCLKILGAESADELSRIVAAVGLVQNLGAIRALTTDGIIAGHMKLHIDNLVLGAGAKQSETPLLKQRLTEALRQSRRISLHNAIEILQEIRDSEDRKQMTEDRKRE